MGASAPILHFDENRSAIIEPSMWHEPHHEMPANGVITWMADAFEACLADNDHEELYHFPIESSVLSVWRVERDDGPVALALAQVGAPISAILLETMGALGVRRFISVGSAGGLVAEHPPGTVVVPSAAIRDEGVSYHYAPPGSLAVPNSGLQTLLLDSLVDNQISATSGIVWTTDAFYRETEAKVARRLAAGAIAVDMEAASLATVADFRGLEYGCAVYMADTLHSETWDPSELVVRNTDFRHRLLTTALDVVVGA
jgi:uridine phosphorylase